MAVLAYVVAQAGRVLTDEWITLAQLSLQEFHEQLRHEKTLSGLFDDLALHKHELFAHVASDVAELYSRLITANEQAARRSSRPDSSRLADLRGAASSVVQYANYYAVREKTRTLQKQLAFGATAFVLGVLLFAFATHPAEGADEGPPSHQGCRLGSDH